MKVELLLCSLALTDAVALQVHHSIGSGVVHLAIVEDLVMFEHTISFLPRSDPMALLVEEAMAIRILNAQSTEAHIVSSAGKMHTFLLCMNIN